LRVAITGAAGFLGGAVARLHQAAGHEVVALSRGGADLADVEERPGDLCDRAYVNLALAGADMVQHIAAKVGTFGRWEEFEANNVTATTNLLTAAAYQGAKGFVYCSSPSVVFCGQPIRGGDERLPLAPLSYSTYSRSKALAEVRVAALAREVGLPALILRPHLIWGPGDRHLLPGLLAATRGGLLPKPWARDPRVDPTHVSDAARAHLLATDYLMETRPVSVDVLFITGAEVVSAFDMAARLIQAAEGRRPRFFGVPAVLMSAAGRVGEIACQARGYRREPALSRFVVQSLLHDQWFSCEAASRILGYEPQTSISEGLAQLTRSRTS